MKKIVLILALVVCSLSAHAQGIRIDPSPITTSAPTVGPGGYPPLLAIPGSHASLCGYPANGIPCTNVVTTYTDSTLSTACPAYAQIVVNGTGQCTTTTDGQGNFGFWVATGGNYAYTITLPTGVIYGPYAVTVGGGGGGVAASISVGSTVTGAPGTAALVQNTGTATAAVLKFTVPQGAAGPPGATGPTGATGPPPAAGSYLVPSNNLGDVSSAATSRLNLGLTFATNSVANINGGGLNLYAAPGSGITLTNPGSNLVNFVNTGTDIASSPGACAAGATKCIVPGTNITFNVASGIYTMNATASGTSTYTSPYGSGAATRTTTGVYSRPSDRISVLDYIPASMMPSVAAATPSSGPDLTTYLQNAINAAQSVGKTLFLPAPYWYHITNHLCITGGFSLEGEAVGVINQTSGGLVNDSSTHSTLLNCAGPTNNTDYTTDLWIRGVQFIGGLNQLDTGSWFNQHISYNVFDSPVRDDWTCSRCERGEIEHNISIQRYRSSKQGYASGQYMESELASTFQLPYETFQDRINFTHNMFLEGGFGIPYTMGTLISGPPVGDGVHYTNDAAFNDSTIDTTIVFGQQNGMCNTNCFTFGLFGSNRIIEFDPDGIGSSSSLVPYILYIAGAMNNSQIDDFAPTFGADNHYTTAIYLGQDVINSTISNSSLGQDTPMNGLVMLGTQTNNLNIIASSGAYYNMSTNPQWRVHTRILGSNMVPNRDNTTNVIQDTNGLNILMNLMNDTTASLPSTGSFIVNGSLGAGGFSNFFRTSLASTEIDTPLSVNTTTALNGNLTVTGTSVTTGNGQTNGNYIVGGNVSGAGSANFGTTGNTVYMNQGQIIAVGAGQASYTAGAVFPQIAAQFGPLQFATPSWFGPAIFGGQGSDLSGVGKICAGYNANNLGCLAEDIAANLLFQSENTAHTAMQTVGYFKVGGSTLVLNNTGGTAPGILSTGTGINADAGGKLTFTGTGSGSTSQSFTFAGTYTHTLTCGGNFTTNDPGAGNYLWFVPNGLTGFTINLHQAVSSGVDVTYSCTAHEN